MKKKLALLLCAMLVLSGCADVPFGQAPASPAAVESAGETASAAEVAVVGSQPSQIALNGDSVKISGNGVTANGSVVTISQPGYYILSGTLSAGQIVVDAGKDAKVLLELSGVDITSAEGPAINVVKAKYFYLNLADGTENTVTDSENYVFAAGEDEPDGAIYSKADMILQGSGSLTVNGNYALAIHGKDGIEITGGDYVLNAVGDGLKGKDFVHVLDGSLTINAQEDGIQSNNSIDAGAGTVSIEGGSIAINSQQDGIQAYNDLTISGGTVSIITAGGSEKAPAHASGFGFPGWNDTSTDETTVSAKGLKSDAAIRVSGGNITLNTMDDAIHCATELSVSGGTLDVAAGDDAFHSDDILNISGGTVNVSASYEALEGQKITVSGGNISLVAEDDGINAAGGDGEEFFPGGPFGGGVTETLEDAEFYFHMTDGTLTLDAGGDGLDSNGALFIDGGIITVSGPENSMNGALDYTTTGQITGGTAVIAGATGMAMNFDYSSTQCSMLYTASETLPGGSQIKLEDDQGNVLVDVTVPKSFRCVVISTPELTADGTYTITMGDSSEEITMTGTVCSLGSSSRGFGPGGGGPGGFGGPPGGW